LSIAAALQQEGYPLLEQLVITNQFEAGVKAADLVFVSSATPLRNDGTEVCGKVGGEVDLGLAQEAARLCVAHSLSLLIRAAEGPLDERIDRVVDVMFFINAVPAFGEHSLVADAGSNLLITVLGSRGTHSRSAIGAGSLVRNVSVVMKAVYRLVS
jgi:enamine deaminase RidA (YjgF/YER057c/UK114 family)